MAKKISVIIPTKNEEHTIEEIVQKCKVYASEVIVVDGHSTDKTKEISEGAGAKFLLDRGKGKGDGLRLAGEEAQGDILVFIDSDGSHDPDDIPRLARPLLDNEADLVTGSRPKGGSDELHGDVEKLVRMIGSDIITITINWRWKAKLSDTQNGFRAILRQVFLDLDLKENGFTIEEEMIMKCLKKGYRVTEVPTHEYERRYGMSRISLWRVSFRFVWVVLKNIFF